MRGGRLDRAVSDLRLCAVFERIIAVARIRRRRACGGQAAGPKGSGGIESVGTSENGNGVGRSPEGEPPVAVRPRRKVGSTTRARTARAAGPLLLGSGPRSLHVTCSLRRFQGLSYDVNLRPCRYPVVAFGWLGGRVSAWRRVQFASRLRDRAGWSTCQPPRDGRSGAKASAWAAAGGGSTGAVTSALAGGRRGIGLEGVDGVNVAAFR